MNDTHNFGLKIVDKSPAEFESVLDYVISTGSPLEIGCYFNEPAALERIVERLNGAAIRVNVHSNQNRMHIHNLNETHPAFAAHIEQALRLGSRYSIAHVSNYPMTTRASRAATLRQRLSDNLLRAEALCAHYDYRIHLENDFQPIAFYRHLFEHIHDLGLQRLHFCLDIGHAKIWSSEKLTDWLDFAVELQKSGFSIHCHLHANSGFGDEHLSLAEARARGIPTPTVTTTRSAIRWPIGRCNGGCRRPSRFSRSKPTRRLPTTVKPWPPDRPVRKVPLHATGTTEQVGAIARFRFAASRLQE